MRGPPWLDRSGTLINAHIPFDDVSAKVQDLSRHPTLVRIGRGDFYEGTVIRFHPDIKVARDGRLGERLVAPDNNDFAPRLGIAWGPGNRWTLRAGAGLFHAQDIGNARFDMSRNIAGRRTDTTDPEFPDLPWDQPFRNLGGAVEIRTPFVLANIHQRRTPYLVLSRAEMESITPPTAHEMQIVEFVQLAEVDPIYFETSFYAAPERGGERAYGLLLAALRTSRLVGIAQVAMHRREHVVVIRSGRSGIVLHTMFYEGEVRREDEYRADTSQIAQKELELALLLVNSLEAPFEASKYRDGYRDKLDALIQAKLAGKASAPGQEPRLAPVVNILEALQRSLDAMTLKRGPSDTPGSKRRRRPSAETLETRDRRRNEGGRTSRPSFPDHAITRANGSVGSSPLAGD